MGHDNVGPAGAGDHPGAWRRRLDESSVIALPKIGDPRGNLTFVEGRTHLPFEIRRVYWIYDVPGGDTRGGHAYHESEELIIAVSGSFDVVLNDGMRERVVPLNRSYFGLYVPNRLWRTINNFSTNALCVVLTSREFDEKDYIRDFDQYAGLQNAG